MSESVEAAVCDWLAAILEVESPPSSAVAFNVGLYETPDGFAAYLIGADHFDGESGDWASNPTYRCDQHLQLTRARHGAPSWELIEKSAATATRRVRLDQPGSFLGRATAVTVGFDEGDLQRVA